MCERLANGAMTRREFAKGAVAASLAAGTMHGDAQAGAAADADELAVRQREIDEVTPADFAAYWMPGSLLAPGQLAEVTAKFPALARLEAAFEKVFREAQETVVVDIDHPAIWYVYNMGVVVKTPKTLFSIDLHHRRAEEFAPILDFALITHNHNDHYTERFKNAMDAQQRKTVVNNFFDNYGVHNWKRDGGYTRERGKAFRLGDVEVVAGLCDHNYYLVDYTTPFEVRIGNFTLLHSGDCSNYVKLDVSRPPDMWIMHPRNWMDAAEACKEKVRPKLAVVAHLQELGHAKGRARWTYSDGLSEKARIEAAGFAAKMPLWGERLA